MCLCTPKCNLLIRALFQFLNAEAAEHSNGLAKLFSSYQTMCMELESIQKILLPAVG